MTDGGIRGPDPAAPPRLLIGISFITLYDVPAWSKTPKGAAEEVAAAVKAAGYEAVQTYEAAPALAAGLIAVGGSRLDAVEDADAIAAKQADAGFSAHVFHAGNGFETDAEIDRLVEAVNEASARHGLPLYIETHRATITQDMKRTLDLVERHPDVRFNGDFSHWYTGQEMTYGDVYAKIDRLRPVTDRTRMIHGRVSSPGAVQIPVADGSQEANVDVFRRFWTRSFEGFLATAQPGDLFGFFPELLPASLNYARLVRGADGALTEEADRWTEALHLVKIAQDCWREATEGPDAKEDAEEGANAHAEQDALQDART